MQELVWWQGDYGRMFFLQTEAPYDMGDQNDGDPLSPADRKNSSNCRVASSVTNFVAYGIGTYSVNQVYR